MEWYNKAKFQYDIYNTTIHAQEPVLSKIKHQIILLSHRMCLENKGSVGRRHVEFAQKFVIWWWIIQVSSLASHDLYSYHAVKRCIFYFANEK